jgi:hypothetical protein
MLSVDDPNAREAAGIEDGLSRTMTTLLGAL